MTKNAAGMRNALIGPVLLALAACSNVAEAATYTMFRDPGCGCCLKWAGHAEYGMVGMQTDGRAQPYQVIASGPSGQKVYASYP
jgi:hypothetical protein